MGDIIVECNNQQIYTVDDLMFKIGEGGSTLIFMIKKTPPEELKKLAISQTPSLRKQMNQKANPDQKVLCYVKARSLYLEDKVSIN